MFKLNKKQLKFLTQRENILLMVVGAIGVWVAWNTLFVVLDNIQLQNQIRETREQVELLELKNQNLQLGIAYYQTNEFLERSAKENLLRKKPNENVAVAPKTKDAPYPPPKTAAKPKEDTRTNWQKWLDFLSGRENRTILNS